MNETVESVLVGLVAAAALTYFGFKVRQDRERLKRIVGIIDANHQFDIGYLLKLSDSGELQDCKQPMAAAGV